MVLRESFKIKNNKETVGVGTCTDPGCVLLQYTSNIH
jgi:hypothetical protein